MIKGIVIWEHQSINQIWFSALINESTPLFGQHGHLGLRYHKGNSVCVNCSCGRRSFHPITCSIEDDFTSWILWDGQCSWVRVRLNLRWGSCNRECMVTKHYFWITCLLQLGISLGCISLQFFAVFFLIAPVFLFSSGLSDSPIFFSLRASQKTLDSSPR